MALVVDKGTGIAFTERMHGSGVIVDHRLIGTDGQFVRTVVNIEPLKLPLLQ